MDYRMPPEPKHVDRKLLYVNLEERIKYLHHMLDFGAGEFHDASSLGTRI